MTDQGAKALAERLLDDIADTKDQPLTEGHAAAIAASLLGPDGLFIADASKHEPIAFHANATTNISSIGCRCGWVGHGDESYFDHIVGAP